MNLLSWYVGKVDENLDDTVLNIRGWSAIIGLVPMIPFAIFDIVCSPSEPSRTIALVPAVALSAFFYGVYAWRAGVALFGNWHGS